MHVSIDSLRLQLLFSHSQLQCKKESLSSDFFSDIFHNYMVVFYSDLERTQAVILITSLSVCLFCLYVMTLLIL